MTRVGSQRHSKKNEIFFECMRILRNVCGFHIVVLVLLYDKGVSIPSNTTMFDFISRHTAQEKPAGYKPKPETRTTIRTCANLRGL
jgi:hypothetical protein